MARMAALRVRAGRGGAVCASAALVLGLGCLSTREAPSKQEQPTPAESVAGLSQKQKGAEGAMGAPAGEAPLAFDSPPGAVGGMGYGGGGHGVRAKADKATGATPSSLAGPAGDGKGLPTGLLPALDPNARYATTYRPGGAALAAFDAALSKGSVGSGYKDLVGDFGGRYAPPMAKPADAAMAFVVDTERAQLAPAGGFIGLRVAMRSSDVMPARAPLSVHLVLDVSGSMKGVAIDNAKKAAATLVEKLDPGDDFSMVTFSNSASLLVGDGLIGPRREAVLSQIKAVVAEGGTNISAGLDLAYEQAHKSSISPDAVRIVMLLSDGHANAGDTSQVTLTDRASKAFQDGIQTSTFGLGDDYDASVMGTIADKGAGGYYYLSDSTQIAGALTKELEARLVPVAQAVEIRVRLRPDVIPARVFGSHALDATAAALVRAQEVAVDAQAQKKDGIKKDREKDAEGGMRFFMPAFARDDRHAMMLTLKVPAGVGERPIASVEIRYKDRLTKKNVTEEIPVRIKYATSEAESAKSANASVLATLQAFQAGDAILRAAELVDMGNRPEAAKLLDERAALLKAASTTLSEPRLLDDAVRLTRLSGAVSGSGQVSENIALSLMLRGSAYGYLR